MRILSRRFHHSGGAFAAGAYAGSAVQGQAPTKGQTFYRKPLCQGKSAGQIWLRDKIWLRGRPFAGNPYASANRPSGACTARGAGGCAAPFSALVERRGSAGAAGARLIRGTDPLPEILEFWESIPEIQGAWTSCLSPCGSIQNVVPWRLFLLRGCLGQGDGELLVANANHLHGFSEFGEHVP